MGWSYKFWVGKLYPEGTKPAQYLAEYAKAMNSVEIDATFYRIPSVSTVETWRDSVPAEFRFSAKFPRTVTHAPGLAYDAERLEIFLRHIEVLGGKLGPLLLQFPPFLKPAYAALDNLLEALPRKRLIAAEFRNRRWFTEETYTMLRDHGVVLASTNQWDAPQMETGSFAYYRVEGDRKAATAEMGEMQVDRGAETTRWAARVRKQLDGGRNVYCYFSKFYSGYPPHNVEALKGGSSPTSGGTRSSSPYP